MSKPQIKEYNCETDIETTRDATNVEISQMEIQAANAVAKQAEAEAKATAKASAKAKLSALGLTEEEITALTN
jgi:hypothetical protein